MIPGIPDGLLDPNPADNPARAGTRAAFRSGEIWVEFENIPSRHLARLEAPPAFDGEALRGIFRLVQPIYTSLPDGQGAGMEVFKVTTRKPILSAWSSLSLTEAGPVFVTQQNLLPYVFEENTIHPLGIPLALNRTKTTRKFDADRVIWYLRAQRDDESAEKVQTIRETLDGVLASLNTTEYDIR